MLGINFSRIIREGMQAALDETKDTPAVNPYRLLSPLWWAWVDGRNQGAAIKRRAVAKHATYSLPANRMKP